MKRVRSAQCAAALTACFHQPAIIGAAVPAAKAALGFPRAAPPSSWGYRRRRPSSHFSRVSCFRVLTVAHACLRLLSGTPLGQVISLQSSGLLCPPAGRLYPPLFFPRAAPPSSYGYRRRRPSSHIIFSELLPRAFSCSCLLALALKHAAEPGNQPAVVRAAVPASRAAVSAPLLPRHRATAIAVVVLHRMFSEFSCFRVLSVAHACLRLLSGTPLGQVTSL